MSLESLFSPKSVLLIGSSKISDKCIMATPEIFGRVQKNLGRYGGMLHVRDIENAGTKSALPECDLTVAVLPPEKIIGILPKLKTKSLVLLSSGFEAKERERLRSFAGKFRILGSNSVCGVINAHNSLNTTFERDLDIRPGKISVISQSGGVGATLLDYMVCRKTGISKFAWVGEMADINECDLLEYMISDEKTATILIYLETIKDTRRFMQIARQSTKPIVILKSGISKEAKKRALTHTDSLSTDYEIYSSAFRQAGVIEAASVRELFNCGLLFERYRKRRVEKIAIVSNTGGSSIIAADFCHRQGLELAELSEKTKREISKKYPSIKVHNPLDMTAGADGERYKFILDVVAKDPRVDAILIINQLKSCLLKPEDLEALKRLKTGKIVVDCAPGDDDFRNIRFFLGDTFPIYNAVEDAVTVIAKAKEYGKR
jgi:acyl-CoA synthetase (NDP forming)